MGVTLHFLIQLAVFLDNAAVDAIAGVLVCLAASSTEYIGILDGSNERWLWVSHARAHTVVDWNGSGRKKIL